MLLVLVQRRRPGGLLGLEIDLDRADEPADRSQHVPCHIADRPVRRERDALHAPVAVLRDRLVGVQVQRDDQCPRPVRGRERKRLPTAGGEPQRRMQELRLGWGERRSKLAENLRVRMKGLARGTPSLIRKCGPGAGHRRRLAVPQRRP